ncbi:MAG: adenylate/guanylate cyclase domain-containing protein [Hyphomicrobium sp.]|jgi:adenylate cyclase
MLEPSHRPRSETTSGAPRLQQWLRAAWKRAVYVLLAIQSRLAVVLRPLLDNAPMRRLRALGHRLAAAGTEGYPPDVKRRLKILNVMCYLIATTTLLYAIQQAATDYDKYAPMVHLNLALVATVLLVPFAHRISDITGGLLLVAVEFAALVGFASFFSREGGGHLQYLIAAAAAFVIFGLERLWLILGVILLAVVLHLYVWYTFPITGPITPDEQAVIDSLYTQGAITTFALIAASVYYAFSLAEQAKAETDAVLRNVLPDPIVERLKANPGALIADSIDDASVMFADISGFVALARRMGAHATVDMLSRIVSEFDALAVRHGVEKIKTIGDAYMVVAGLPEPVADHTVRLARMGLDMLTTVERLRSESGIQINLRIGMASGPVMAGVIGTKKFSYDVWGDPVNLASRLEGQSIPGRILICPQCRAKLGEGFIYEAHTPIEIKGIGTQEVWFLLAEKGSADEFTPSARPRSRNAS